MGAGQPQGGNAAETERQLIRFLAIGAFILIPVPAQGFSPGYCIPIMGGPVTGAPVHLYFRPNLINHSTLLLPLSVHLCSRPTLIALLLVSSVQDVMIGKLLSEADAADRDRKELSGSVEDANRCVAAHP